MSGKKAWIKSLAIIVQTADTSSAIVFKIHKSLSIIVKALMIGLESTLKATFETFSRGFQLKEARVDIKTKTTIAT